MKHLVQIVCFPQSDRRNSFGRLKQQQKKKNSSPPTSSQSSEDDFLSPPRTKSKASPCHRRARPSSSGQVRDGLGEEERQRWRTFRERKTPYRSAVFGLHPRKPRSNPSEPSECGAPPQLLFLAALCQPLFFICPVVVLSSEEEDEGEDEGDDSRVDVPGSSEPTQVGDPRWTRPGSKFTFLWSQTLS